MWPFKKEIPVKPENDIQFLEGKSCTICLYSLTLFASLSARFPIKICIKCGNIMKESVIKKIQEYILYRNKWVLYYNYLWSLNTTENKSYYIFDHWL